MDVEPDLGATLESIREERLQVVAGPVDLDVPLARAGGLLLEDVDDHIHRTVLLHDSVTALEAPGVLFRDIPESGVEERLPVVGDDDGIESFSVLHKPLGPAHRHGTAIRGCP